MGIGMVVVCAASDLEAVQRAIDEPTWVIGRLEAGSGTVHLDTIRLDTVDPG
jgi:phosphoribosylaminoimidazole (AIR) synthetase